MNIGTVSRDYSFSMNGFLIKEFKKGKSYILSQVLMRDIMATAGNDLFGSIRELDGSVYKKYSGENLDGKSILIWRTGGMGDLCFITPYLKKLKELYPKSKIVFGCGVQYSDVMSEHPHIDEFHVLPIDTDVMKQCDYHLMFEGIIEANPDAAKKNAYDLFGDYFRVTLEDHEKIPNLPVNQENLEYFKKADQQFITVKDPIRVGFHLKTSSIIRDVPVSAWQKLFNGMLLTHPNIAVYFLGSREDVEVGSKIILSSNASGRVLPFYQIVRGFRDGVAAISQMDLVIGGDSSGLHVAAAFGVPLIGLFGAFLPELRLKYYKNSCGIESKIKCSPCFLHGNESCENSDMHGTSYCMMLFHDTNKIIDEAMMLLAINKKVSLNYLSPKAATNLLGIYKETFGEKRE